MKVGRSDHAALTSCIFLNISLIFFPFPFHIPLPHTPTPSNIYTNTHSLPPTPFSLSLSLPLSPSLSSLMTYIFTCPFSLRHLIHILSRVQLPLEFDQSFVKL